MSYAKRKKKSHKVIVVSCMFLLFTSLQIWIRISGKRVASGGQLDSQITTPVKTNQLRLVFAYDSHSDF